jgi:hypothetical protein
MNGFSTPSPARGGGLGRGLLVRVCAVESAPSLTLHRKRERGRKLNRLFADESLRDRMAAAPAGHVARVACAVGAAIMRAGSLAAAGRRSYGPTALNR